MSLKQTLSILSIFVLLLPTISRVCILVDFELHKAYIANVLCIKKDTANNCCQGKCHLKKQLKKTEEKADTNPLKTTSQDWVLNLCLPKHSFLLKLHGSVNNKLHFNAIFSLKNIALIRQLFRPPEIL